MYTIQDGVAFCQRCVDPTLAAASALQTQFKCYYSIIGQ